MLCIKILIFIIGISFIILMAFYILAELTRSNTLERIADKISTILFIIFLVALTTLLEWGLFKFVFG